MAARRAPSRGLNRNAQPTACPLPHPLFGGRSATPAPSPPGSASSSTRRFAGEVASPLPPFARIGVQLAQAFGDGVDVGLGGGAEAFGEVGDLVGAEVVAELAGAGDGGGEGGAGADPFVEGEGAGHVGLFREAAERGTVQDAVFDALGKLRRAVAGDAGWCAGAGGGFHRFRASELNGNICRELKGLGCRAA